MSSDRSDSLLQKVITEAVSRAERGCDGEDERPCPEAFPDDVREWCDEHLYERLAQALLMTRPALQAFVAFDPFYTGCSCIFCGTEFVDKHKRSCIWKHAVDANR